MPLAQERLRDVRSAARRGSRQRLHFLIGDVAAKLLKPPHDEGVAILAARRVSGQGGPQTGVRWVDEVAQDVRLGLSVKGTDLDARDDFHSDELSFGDRSGPAGEGI